MLCALFSHIEHKKYCGFCFGLFFLKKGKWNALRMNQVYYGKIQSIKVLLKAVWILRFIPQVDFWVKMNIFFKAEDILSLSLEQSLWKTKSLICSWNVNVKTEYLIFHESSTPAIE